MLWIILGILAAAAWSFAAFIDNYLTDVIFKGKTPQAVKFINGPVNIAIGIAVAIICQIQIPEWWQAGLLMLSGAISAVGVIAYYQALKYEESTGAAIFYQLQPIMFLLIDRFMFGEQISQQQILGFIIILLAPVVIVLANKRARARKFEMAAAGLLILYVFVATISAEISTRTGEGIDFPAIFSFFIIGKGVADILLGLFIPGYRKRHHYILKRYKLKYCIVAAFDQLICAVADFTYRYSLIIGIAALSSAITNASELIITFTLGIILSAIWPNLGREKLQRRLIIGHIIAVILCVIGIIIIQ